jgi:hypothetical protein
MCSRRQAYRETLLHSLESGEARAGGKAGRLALVELPLLSDREAGTSKGRQLMERSTEAGLDERMGAPRSHQRTWEDNDFFPLLFLGQVAKALEGLPPDFLWSSVESRTSCGFPYRKPHTRTWVVPRTGNPGRPIFFVPRTLGRTWGTHPVPDLLPDVQPHEA